MNRSFFVKKCYFGWGNQFYLHYTFTLPVKYTTIPPSRPLSEFVRFYWVLEGEGAYSHHSMADVCAEMLFHYKGQFTEAAPERKGEKTFLAGLSAQTSGTRRFDISESFGIFGIYLFPDAISRLFGIRASELAEEMPDLVSLLGPEGRILESQMLSAKSNPERIRLIESFFLSRLSQLSLDSRPVFSAMRELMHHREPLKVKSLADKYCLSERQLERQFKNYSGFSPKKFQRISRFHFVTSQYGVVDRSLADIALECGYYDQAHFCADFKQFSGITPRQFFSGTTDATLWRD